MASTVSELQKCMDMIEALVEERNDVKNFRNHCLDIIQCAQTIHPVLAKLQKEHPEIVEANGSAPIFKKLHNVAEEALLVIRKTATLSQIEKFLDHGESKHKLDDILEGFQSAAREMDAYVNGYLNSAQLARSSGTSGEGTAIVIEGADLQEGPPSLL